MSEWIIILIRLLRRDVDGYGDVPFLRTQSQMTRHDAQRRITPRQRMQLPEHIRHLFVLRANLAKEVLAFAVCMRTKKKSLAPRILILSRLTTEDGKWRWRKQKSPRRPRLSALTHTLMSTSSTPLAHRRIIIEHATHLHTPTQRHAC